MTAWKIMQHVRDYAAKMNESAGSDAAEAGMVEMSKKFREMGSELYVDAKASNKALSLSAG